MMNPRLYGIVDAGLLVDDSPQWCTGTVSQARAKDGRRRVAVVLYEGADG